MTAVERVNIISMSSGTDAKTVGSAPTMTVSMKQNIRHTDSAAKILKRGERYG